MRGEWRSSWQAGTSGGRSSRLMLLGFINSDGLGAYHFRKAGIPDATGSEKIDTPAKQALQSKREIEIAVRVSRFTGCGEVRHQIDITADGIKIACGRGAENNQAVDSVALAKRGDFRQLVCYDWNHYVGILANNPRCVKVVSGPWWVSSGARHLKRSSLRRRFRWCRGR